MSESTIATPTPCTKTPGTLLDAYQDGRITRDELLDHLLEWRKAAPATPIRITPMFWSVADQLLEAQGVVNAIQLMARGLDDEDDRYAFHIVTTNLDDLITEIREEIKAEKASD